MRHYMHSLPGGVDATPLDVLPELVIGSQPAFIAEGPSLLLACCKIPSYFNPLQKPLDRETS